MDELISEVTPPGPRTFSVENSPEIQTRDELPLLCDWRKLETAVEIGVERGVFSQLFMSRARRLRHYIGVDTYAPHWEFPGERETDMTIAAMRYSQFAVGSLMRMSGSQLAHAIRTGELGHIKEQMVDFVYHDAGHDYKDVIADIYDWWELISPQGIMAGHDYDPTHPGVVEAVNMLAEEYGLTVYLTQEPCASWYVYKSGIPGPEWRRN